ncbi:oxidoreductase [Pseudoalteromonas sp. NBT06-2]|uniref:DoxX family protein n=1 Tax=Pseudoalteromonas sp. NBT06-2 TaxID=2025950 RepID=UPI000BA5B018|nr:DoxX family protein [Pseudoalteromonas sp. NBT06-2]PAJ75123.1 oxidoreductase [Pseudoalteromonas sp. NBT06-2]
MKQLIQNTIFSKSGLDTVALRFGAGAIFFAHGAQKLFGWFEGYGLEGTGGWMESIGITPEILMATMVSSAEFFGGLFLMLGLLVRPTSIILAITMLVAIFSVHINNGLFMSNNGYEFALSLLIISISLAFRGAGSLSVDKLVTKKLGA